MEAKKLIIYTTLSLILAAPVCGSAEQKSSAQEQMQRQIRTQVQSQLMNMQVKQINGKTVVNALGEDLGKVRSVVQNRTDNRVNAVVAVGGVFGLGAKKIPVPIDQLQLQEDMLVWNSSISKDQFSQQPEYQQAQYNEINESQKLADVSGIEIQGMERQMTFQELDIDNSGFLTPNEIQSDQKLSTNWQKVDKNRNDQVDRSEFSAFESILTEPLTDLPEIQEQTPK